MVVTAKMQDAVEYQLFDLGVEREIVFLCLAIGLCGRYYYITEAFFVGVDLVGSVGD